MRPALVLLIATTACGHHADPDMSLRDASGVDDASTTDGVTMPVDAMPDSATVTTPDAAMPDAFVFPSTLDLKINCRNDCVLVANPSSIGCGVRL